MTDAFSTQNDLSVARDIGALQSDVRTIKHDVANMSGKMDGLSRQIASITNDRAKGMGFWAGALFVVTTGLSVAGAVFALVRSALGGH